jgi:hypothetical protein
MTTKKVYYDLFLTHFYEVLSQVNLHNLRSHSVFCRAGKNQHFLLIPLQYAMQDLEWSKLCAVLPLIIIIGLCCVHKTPLFSELITVPISG